jgi:SH3-like domain-containing protein
MWVYRREGLPVRVVRLLQGWRYVEEQDGTRGWILSGFLSTRRTAVVVGEGLAPMRASPQAGAELRWNLEPGVIGDLGDCEAGWCELDVAGHRGWVEEARLWGAGEA